MFGRALVLSAASLLFAAAEGAVATPSAPGDTSSTVTLAADFNGDLVGQPPDVTLPGAPVGDYLTLNQEAGTVEVVSSIDGLTNKPVLLKQNNDVGGVALFAWAAGPPPGLESVTLRWRSLARDDNPVTLLRCAARAASGAILGSVEYRPHGELTYNSVGGSNGPTLPVSYQQNRSQQFTMVVDFLAGTTSLAVDDVPVPGFQSVPFAEAGADFGSAIFDAEGPHPQSLVVDDVSAVAFCRAPDHAPEVTAPAFAAGSEGAPLHIDVTAADPDGEAISSLTAAPLPAGAAFSANGANTAGSLDWTPDFTQAGEYDVTFTATNALSGSASTHITISGTDRAPVLTAPPAVDGEEGGTLDFLVTVEDPDGDPVSSLSASLEVLPVGNFATFTPDITNTSGQFYWPMKVGEAGQYLMTFTAASGALTGSAQTVINVAVSGISVSGFVYWTPQPGSAGSYFVTFTAVDQFGDVGQSVTEIVVSDPLPGAGAPLDLAPSAISPRTSLAPGTASNIQKGPVVSSPSRVDATVSEPVVVEVTATDTTGTGGAATAAPVLGGRRTAPAGSVAGQVAGNLTLTADLSQLGPNAVFIVDKDPIVNAPANVSGHAVTPMMFQVGATDPDGDPILTLTADLAAFPAGNQPSFTVNGAHTVATFAWTPGPADSGDYEAFFTATNQLVGRAATTIHVQGIAATRVFLLGKKKIRLNSNKASDCVLIEPVGGSFSLTDIDVPTIRMISMGTGVVSSIPPILKSIVIGDRDGNQVSDMTVCFTKADLKLLFSELSGNNQVPVTMEGALVVGGRFGGTATLPIAAGGGGGNQATVSPNPMNPVGTLSFSIERPGDVRVRLFDMSGRLVRELMDRRHLEAGEHEILINGRNGNGQRLASGIYFFRVESPDGIRSGRFAIMK
jgi:hypothetical protein